VQQAQGQQVQEQEQELELQLELQQQQQQVARCFASAVEAKARMMSRIATLVRADAPSKHCTMLD
jgi:hypothetical protein